MIQTVATLAQCSRSIKLLEFILWVAMISLCEIFLNKQFKNPQKRNQRNKDTGRGMETEGQRGRGMETRTERQKDGTERQRNGDRGRERQRDGDTEGQRGRGNPVGQSSEVITDFCPKHSGNLIKTEPCGQWTMTCLQHSVDHIRRETEGEQGTPAAGHVGQSRGWTKLIKQLLSKHSRATKGSLTYWE